MMAAAARTSGTRAPSASTLYRGVCSSSHWALALAALALASRARRDRDDRTVVDDDTRGFEWIVRLVFWLAVLPRWRVAASTGLSRAPKLSRMATRPVMCGERLCTGASPRTKRF